MKVNILEYTDKIDSVCSLWRSRGVLSEIERSEDINIVSGNWDENWSTIRKFHIAFFMRPIHKNCVDQVMLCKDLGLKIWIDLDDWKKCPKEHPLYEVYQQSFDELSFKKTLYCADVITVTNDRMLSSYTKVYPELADKFLIVPNAINDYVYPFSPLSTNRIIVYRGGSNHSYDVKVYQDVLRKVMIDNPDWHFVSIGQEIRRLKTLKNYQHIGRFEFHSYFGAIRSINPAIFVVPLKDNEFNRCKSNISWLEGTMAGAACLCPDYFTDTAKSPYSNIEEFERNFRILIDDHELRGTLYAHSVEMIQENFLLSNVNKQRIELIKKLL